MKNLIVTAVLATCSVFLLNCGGSPKKAETPASGTPASSAPAAPSAAPAAAAKTEAKPAADAPKISKSDAKTACKAKGLKGPGLKNCMREMMEK